MNTITLLFLTSMTLLTGLVLNKTSKTSSQAKGQTIAGKSPDTEALSLKITVGDQYVIAEFIDSETTRDFIKRLPLTLSMQDIGNREKYSSISGELSKKGIVKTKFRRGDISYWLGGGIAAFYNQDDHQVKVGLIVLARVEQDIALFSAPGSVTATFEAVKK